MNKNVINIIILSTFELGVNPANTSHRSQGRGERQGSGEETGRAATHSPGKLQVSLTIGFSVQGSDSLQGSYTGLPRDGIQCSGEGNHEAVTVEKVELKTIGKHFQQAPML